MAVASRVVQGSSCLHWLTGIRPVCYEKQCSGRVVLFTSKRRRNGSNRCATGPLAGGSLVCVSPFLRATADTETDMGPGNSNLMSCPLVAQKAVVSGHSQNVHRSRLAAEAKNRSSHSRPPSASSTGLIQADHLEVEWEALSGCVFSFWVLGTLLSSRRPSSNRMYASTVLGKSSDPGVERGVLGLLPQRSGMSWTSYEMAWIRNLAPALSSAK